MNRFKTIAAFSYTILAAIVFLVVAIPASIASLLGLKKTAANVVYFMGKIWGRGIIAITGCRMTVEGRENIPRGGGVCFVSNHVGMFDIVLALAYIGRPFGFIAKRELRMLPVFNLWIYILGGLFIDRKNIRNAIKTMNHGIEKIQKGNAMLIFPEGTRSKGQGLLPFRSGSIKLATNSLAPIVPIAISGSYDVFEKNHSVRPVAVRMVFCPPIPTVNIAADERRSKLADLVRDTIGAALGEQGTGSLDTAQHTA
ncbi:MAG: 1-acyl-sn-glycerol-3-phosphate acyltransferase [Treponema sp.]|jgi:1-acyl-sn-glycerol-3-phosphate acyltransferase|nr:1-acyl-sn-glycerol-3-phosphate acyltransferase [Treponema sp.]